MASLNNYIKLPNQGNINSNIRLLYEMYNSSGYSDAHGYFTKSDVAEIAANALLITTSSKIGKDILGTIRDEKIEEEDNSPLQNAKMRMQILRILGLVSADYNSEIYAITELGDKFLSDSLTKIQKRNLIRELFLCITSSSESYDFTCSEGFHCYLGLQIYYALANLDFKLGVDEMPIITTYDYRDINDFIERVKLLRKNGISFSKTDPHFPKTKKGNPLAQPNNITRTINQILRYCNIIDSKPQKVDGKNYYVCSEEGKVYVSKIKELLEKGQLVPLTPFTFRKGRILEQKDKCRKGLEDIFIRAKIIDDKNIQGSGLIFSPYQILPETTVTWLLKGDGIRPHPEKVDSKVQAINSSLTASDLRLRAIYETNSNNHVEELKDSEIIIQDMLKCTSKDDKLRFISSQIDNHRNDDKTSFYPYIHSLLRILGLDCRGEVARYDALAIFCEHYIPVEIKSPTEETTYNQKGLRQAIENKVCSYNALIADDLEYATLVVGYNHPLNNSDIKNIIDASHEQLKINIIATDLESLLKICIKVVCDNMRVDLNMFLKNYGILME